MTNSNGVFALTLNSPASTRTDGNSYSVEKMLGNIGTFSLAGGACSSGTTYSPGSTDGRVVVVSFKDSTMGSFDAFPANVLAHVPKAIDAEQVGGFPSTSLLRVQNGTTPGAATALTSADMTTLGQLISGTSPLYLSSGANGTLLPSFASNPASPAEGDVWYNTATHQIEYYNGTSSQAVSTGGGGGSGTVTQIIAGTGLSGGTITTSGTISLPNTGTAGTYTKVTTDAQGRVSAGANITGSDITSGTIGGSTSLNTSGTVTATSVGTNSLLLYSGVKSISLSAPAGLASNLTWTLPGAAPAANGYVLSSTTAGVLSWISPGGGGGVTSVSGTAPISVANGSTTPVISLSSGSATGQTLRWNGTNWAAAQLNYEDLVNVSSLSPWPSSTCAAGSFLTWSSVLDGFSCTALSGSMVTTALGAAPFLNGGNAFGGPATLGTTDNNTLSIATNNQTRMTIDTSGKVGIGTTSPTNPFTIVENTVAGNSASVQNTNPSGYSEFTGYDSTGSQRYALGFGNPTAQAPYAGRSYLWMGSGTDLAIVNNSDTVTAIFKQTGNVGIGTSTPAVSLDLGSTTDALRLPSGTTAQQPSGGSLAAGEIRYNNTATPGTVEYYNGSAWVTVSTGAAGTYLPESGGTMTGPLIGSDGTASAPGYTFAGDTNTGFYDLGGGAFGVASAGNSIATFNSSSFTLAANEGLTMNSGTGRINQTYTGISDAYDLTTSASGSTGINITSSANGTPNGIKVTLNNNNTGYAGNFINAGGGVSANYGVSGTTNTNGAGYGVYGAATGATNTGYGVYGTNSSNQATSGVYGAMTNSSNAGYGVYGTNASTGTGAGVYGSQTGATNTGYGVYGTNSSSGTAYGVYGSQTTNSNTGYAVYGTNSSNVAAYGVYGMMSNGANTGYAVYGNNASTGSAYGVYGTVSGANNTGYGVYGTNASSGTSYGVYGSQTNTSNTGYGVYGTNAATGSAYGVFGSETGAGNTGYGVYGTNSTFNGGYGVYGTMTNTGNSGYGVYGTNASSGAAYGVYGNMTSTSNTGYAVYGTNATSNAGYGVYGTVTNTGNNGYGVYGTNLSMASGYGVYGSVTGTGNTGYGVYGTNSSGGTAYGVYGAETGATNSGAAGKFVNSGTVTVNYGVYATTSSGTAGVGVYAAQTGGSNTGYAIQAVNTSPSGWTLYASGTSPNYFAASVGIGTTTPVNALDVSNGGGIRIATGTPASTGSALYNVGGTLMWNGSAVGGGSFSSITGASGTDTLDNTNFAQIWNWTTATTQNPMTMTSNALTTGSLLSLTSSSASLNSTNGLLYVANTGASTTGEVARIQSNSTAGSGLTVLANGNVGIGTATPSHDLSFGGASDRTIWLERNPAASAGGNLFIQGGGAGAGANLNGGAVILQSGAATGNGGSDINLEITNGSQGAGSTVRQPSFATSIAYFSGVNRSIALGESETVTGQYSFGINLDGSSAQTLSQANTMAIMGGNVGIGTNLPNATLEVNGGTKIDNGSLSINNFSNTTYSPSSQSWVNPAVNLLDTFHLDNTGTQINFGQTNTAGTVQNAYIGAFSNTSGYSPTIFFMQQTGAATFAERMRIDPSGNVGIGTTSAGSLLQVGSNFTVDSSGNASVNSLNTTNFIQAADSGHYTYSSSGTGAIAPYNAANTLGLSISNGDPHDGNYISYAFGTANTNGNVQNAYIAAVATTGNTTYTPAIVIGQQSGSNAYAERMRIDSAGNVGIGTTAPGYPLDVNGNVRATAFISTSDRRAKANIETLDGEDSLRKICSVRPVSFNWKSDGSPDLGVIAQELEDVFPQMVMQNPDGSFAVKYNSLISPIIASIQTLNKQNQDLVRQNQGLVEKNQDLERRLKALEDKVNQLIERPGR